MLEHLLAFQNIVPPQLQHHKGMLGGLDWKRSTNC